MLNTPSWSPLVCTLLALACFCCVPLTAPVTAQPQSGDGSDVAIAIHGGAGTIKKENMTDEQEQAYRAKLREALSAGHEVLTAGGTATDAVIAAISVMEESPLFNAARGAVLTSAQTVELDASIMRGEDRQAGAVTGIKHVKSPIRLARDVMNHSKHVMLAGDGAEEFARERDLETVPNAYFIPESRMEEGTSEGDGATTGAADPPSLDASPDDDAKYGTVGAVALDQDGNLAAGTSTGGLSDKRPGRIGDSPIIGAGTYAFNETCAVSATGQGEYFIRTAAAHTISARMRLAGVPLQEAAESVIQEDIGGMGALGGAIALDREGNIAMPFNTAGMYRGFVDTSGETVVRIYGNEGGETMDP
jgi:beta-aspartyl-peptidase (threonine type)